MPESHPTGTTPVTDRRPTPRGVLPRGMQTWVMAGIAGVMLLIIFVAGRPEQATRRVPVAMPVPPASPDRLREYQDRLRVMEARAAQDAPRPVTSSAEPPGSATGTAPRATSQDPLVAERRRREYESLFASNIVLSRRPEGERPDGDRRGSTRSATPGDTAPRSVVGPTIDEVADAVVRASARATARDAKTTLELQPAMSEISPSVRAESTTAPRDTSSPETASRYRLLEGTVIDTVLTNRLDGALPAPVNCLVTNALYAHEGAPLVIPAGARILGQTKPVQAFGETRLAVAFHRLTMPDGHSYSLEQLPALNQIGDAGLRDQVNQHYASTFGAAAAVGLISGLSQLLGTAAFNGRSDQHIVVMSGGAVDATAQASLQVMNRFLNRLPTVTIREGHRVKVYLTRDLELPAYDVVAGF